MTDRLWTYEDQYGDVVKLIRYDDMSAIALSAGSDNCVYLSPAASWGLYRALGHALLGPDGQRTATLSDVRMIIQEELAAQAPQVMGLHQSPQATPQNPPQRPCGGCAEDGSKCGRCGAPWDDSHGQPGECAAPVTTPGRLMSEVRRRVQPVTGPKCTCTHSTYVHFKGGCVYPCKCAWEGIEPDAEVAPTTCTACGTDRAAHTRYQLCVCGHCTRQHAGRSGSGECGVAECGCEAYLKSVTFGGRP